MFKRMSFDRGILFFRAADTLQTNVAEINLVNCRSAAAAAYIDNTSFFML